MDEESRERTEGFEPLCGDLEALDRMLRDYAVHRL
jgi:hypothetical protein